MVTVNILMVADIEGALSSGDLQRNIYLVDTNKYRGSANEGQSNLITALSPQNYIRWSVVPVQPDGQVTIVGFGGQAVEENIIRPAPILDTGSWETKFTAAPPSPGVLYEYTATLNFEWKSLSFQSYLLSM